MGDFFVVPGDTGGDGDGAGASGTGRGVIAGGVSGVCVGTPLRGGLGVSLPSGGGGGSNGSLRIADSGDGGEASRAGSLPGRGVSIRLRWFA